ncbi:SH3 domain-containing protein 19 [Diretmus argenteus]
MAEARREGEEEEEWRNTRSRDQATATPVVQTPSPCPALPNHPESMYWLRLGPPQQLPVRPEITILSVEPLANNTWFSGASGVFPPSSQPSWSGSIQAVSQPPPSYDQVIKEKTQEEHIAKPTAAPRRSTCATQTDPVREDTAATAPQCSAVQQPTEKRAAQSPSTPAENSPSSDSEHTQCPIPLPRFKSRKQPITDEVQTLVRLSENGDVFPVTSSTDPEELSSSTYLKELLEAFSVENLWMQSCDSCDSCDQSDESEQIEDAGGEMSALHSQRNIRARIQAFESQTSTDEGNVVELAKRPEPSPRNVYNKPPVAAKPSLAPKPSKPLFNHSIDNNNQEVSSTNPTPAPRPQPSKKPVGYSLKEEPETLLTKVAILPPPRRSILTRAKCVQSLEDETPEGPPEPPVKPLKEPLKPNLNLNNHNSAFMVTDNEYVDSPSNHFPVKPQQSVDSGGSFSRQNITRRPTTIRVPSKADILSDDSLDCPPPLPAQKPVGSLTSSVSPKPILPSQDSFNSGPEPSLPPRSSGGKVLPPRPPPAKVGPGRPPPPRLDSRSRPKPQAQKPKRKGPVLPPRPNPGHRLYNKYTLELPHGIAAHDYNGSNTGELSFQKNEVLLLLEETDHRTFVCQVGDTRGRVQKSHMKVITPLSSVSAEPPPQGAGPAGSGRGSCGLKVQAIHDFTPEGAGELGLKVGDVVNMVEQVNSDWYRGSCRGSTGFFPINYVKVLSYSPKPTPETKGKPPSAAISGPRCVARFDFEGEHSDELSFSEGDVIRLKEYAGQEWARGQLGVFTGIFPLNFVEVIEDLPPPPTQKHTQPTKIALPGMVSPLGTHSEVAKPVQASQSGVEWVVALYDFSGQAGDLSFQQGDCILITQHIDAEWCSGRLNGREGIFPSAFVETSTAPPGQLSAPDSRQSGAAGTGTAKALFDFTSDCDEELSLQVGDIITNLESVDEEWFLGDLRGQRAMVPKNYVQVLG